MKKIKFKTDFKFKLSIVALSLLMFLGVLSYQFTDKNFYIISTIIGILSLIVIILSVIGFFRSLKYLRESKSKKRIMAILVTSFVGCFFLYIIISNLMAAIKFLT